MEKIDCEVIRNSTAALLAEFDLVLLEGAGGLMVPLNTECTLLDYLEEKNIRSFWLRVRGWARSIIP